MYKWVVAGSGETSEAGQSGKKAIAHPIATSESRGGMGSGGNPRAGIIVPIIGYMTIILLVFIPFNILFKRERFKFLRSMKKALFSKLKAEVTFADVILADILTSFARVFGDLAVALCLMFWDRDGTRTDACYGSILVPIMTSIPYCIRLRQCLSEYIESNYTTERHLMNALKYALFFVALNSFYSFYWDIYHDWNLVQVQPIVGNRYSPLADSGHSRMNTSPPSPIMSKSLSGTMIEAGSGINSANKSTASPPSSGSTNGSSDLKTAGTGGTGNRGESRFFGGFKRLMASVWPSRFSMRSFLHYEDPLFYYFAVVLDFLLRTTWMLKVVLNIQIEEYDGGVFAMECLEVFRRWIWVLFRLESEMVKRAGFMEPSGPLPSGVLGGGGGTGHMDLNGSGEVLHDGSILVLEDLELWQK
ncbi:protein-ER retention protein [Lunasporangiospora selenospora]|uniref:Protein-ER retention protein n=1 Tax=Lunasporangiospora selenospora TaxID=979761 RepID=A0A9P6G1I9_9FUNG|nr:protein-ER retention protein [Lunasporangiospora selenospora]